MNVPEGAEVLSIHYKIRVGRNKMTEKEYKIEIDPRILELLGLGLYTNILCLQKFIIRRGK